MKRWQLAVLALAILVAPTPSRADEPGGVLAILVRNPEATNGDPPYALADQFGRVQRLVEPSPGVELSRYVGQRVRVRHDTGRTLLASQLELPGAGEFSAPREVAPPRELREVSPAQFIPPRGATRIQATLPEGRQAVVPAQLRVDDEDPTTPIDLDELLENERANLPESTSGDSIEPIPAGEPYGEPVQPESIRAEPYSVGPSFGGPTTDGYMGGDLSHASCPHCNGQGLRYGGCEMCAQRGGLSAPCCEPGSQRGPYGRAEYLIWWFDGMNAPPLVTSNTQGNAPTLSQAGTVVAHNPSEMLEESRSGLRLSLGAWLDNRRDLAIEGDWTTFETASDTFNVIDQLGTGTIGRPYYNVDTGLDDARVIAMGGTTGGVLTVYERSQFRSFGLRARTGIACHEVGGCQTPNCPTCNQQRLGRFLSNLRSRERPAAISRVDFIAGYRYSELEEQILFRDSVTMITPATTTSVSETFETDNDFNGADLGFLYEWRSRRWGAELLGKVAIGGTRQRVSIYGATDDGTNVTPGGLLAQSTNIGVYERDRFSVLPELSARVSYHLTDDISLSAAYSLMYWANVVRPGDIIDTSVGTSVASAYSHPYFDWEETGLWAHGLNFGLDYRY